MYLTGTKSETDVGFTYLIYELLLYLQMVFDIVYIYSE